VVCPTGASCTHFQDVDIHLHWVCDDSAPTCQESDFYLATTVNGTVIFDPNGFLDCAPTSNPGVNGFDTCGFIAPPPCDDGYLIAWVVDDASLKPIKFDGLIGDATLRQDESTAVTAYNAIPIQAGAKLANGAFTDLYSNGHLNFNGVAYKELSDTIIGSVRYPGTDPATGIDSDTEFVLLTLDTLSNRPNNDVVVDLNACNELEQCLSFQTQFTCTEEVFLDSELGLTNAFGQKGLVTGTASKVSAPGIADKHGPVTLLGLIIVHEDSFAREYAYPFLDNSVGLATSFVP
jgi:hypothetical protein